MAVIDTVTWPVPAVEAMVIPDPYEFEEREPHCNGTNLLWFGHHVNRSGLERIMPDIKGYPLRVVSNFDGAIPWSVGTMVKEFKRADIVIIPETAKYKSNNRALEAIRQGCFVVAEPHPSLNDLPGIWVGNIKEGIEWTRRNLQEANERTKMAQKYVRDAYSHQTLALAWKTAIQRPTTSEVAVKNGTDG